MASAKDPQPVPGGLQGNPIFRGLLALTPLGGLRRHHVSWSGSLHTPQTLPFCHLLHLGSLGVTIMGQDSPLFLFPLQTASPCLPAYPKGAKLDQPVTKGSSICPEFGLPFPHLPNPSHLPYPATISMVCWTAPPKCCYTQHM